MYMENIDELIEKARMYDNLKDDLIQKIKMYDELKVDYKDFVVEWINNGASVIGGCCRTTTDHIKEIKKIVENI